ncbi:MAG: C45 family peptidase [Acetobacter sp.]|uniref:C45 family autoproteolytic acyltransferase/hydolase n=1 Tax=Acetobacter sp. TaxID=440 RepID=UPI0039E98F99
MFTEQPHRLAGLDISGTPYEIGHALGRHGAAVAHGYLVRTHGWAAVTGFCDQPFMHRAHILTQTRFPQFYEELRGLADGLELPFDAVFAWNCRGDIRAMNPDGCTTVQLPGPSRVVAHNEDGDPGLRAGCALATVRPRQGRRFTAFVYPASIPGHTFSLNDAGVVMTVNNIRSLAGGDGLPRMVLTRALLDCGSTAQCVEMLETLPRSGGFHLTLARPVEADSLSVEFTHGGLSVTPIVAPGAHANHLVHDAMRSAPQTVTQSSRARQVRADSLIARAERHDAGLALEILRDTQNKALPIFRTQPDDPDHENTLASAVFTLGQDRVDCAVYDNTSSTPCFRFICRTEDDFVAPIPCHA